MCSDLNTSGKLSKLLNKKRKDGFTVFAELNTGGELCKKDKLSSIYDASSVSYFYFVLCRPLYLNYVYPYCC